MDTYKCCNANLSTGQQFILYTLGLCITYNKKFHYWNKSTLINTGYEVSACIKMINEASLSMHMEGENGLPTNLHIHCCITKYKKSL